MLLSAHLGYLFTELPLEQRFAAAREAGFSHVEHPAPYALPAERLKQLCADNGLHFVQLALPAGDASRGEKGIACLPGRRAEFEQSLDVGLAYARTVGADFVHVMSGITPKGDPSERLHATYVENLRMVCRAATLVGIDVLIEPIGPGTLPNYYMSDPHEALRVIDEVGQSNLFMLFDAFHAAMADIDPTAFVRQHNACIRHVHVADLPGRHEPGTGTIDFAALFRELSACRYGGAVGLEYVPNADTVNGLHWREAFA